MRMIYALMTLSFGLISSNLMSQNFTFSPSTTVSATVEMDMYSEMQINVFHDLSDSAYISWRFIEDDYPEAWDVQLCDWQHCYSYIPFNGDMLGVAQGNSGFLRLLINPFNTAGSGHLQFWVYPTGDMENYTEVDFYIETTVAAVAQTEVTPYLTVIANNEILAQHFPQGTLELFNAQGQLLQSDLVQSTTHRMSVGHLSRGWYLIRDAKGRTYTWIKS